jgi:transposase-like protein
MNFKARQRAELILKVRSGQLTATAAAQALGISRQQYYQWEARALQALLGSPGSDHDNHGCCMALRKKVALKGA